MSLSGVPTLVAQLLTLSAPVLSVFILSYVEGIEWVPPALPQFSGYRISEREEKIKDATGV
jgi:uncharacterized membrane protein HdeD (DUF308 family)